MTRKRVIAVAMLTAATLAGVGVGRISGPGTATFEVPPICRAATMGALSAESQAERLARLWGLTSTHILNDRKDDARATAHEAQIVASEVLRLQAEFRHRMAGCVSALYFTEFFSRNPTATKRRIFYAIGSASPEPASR